MTAVFLIEKQKGLNIKLTEQSKEWLSKEYKEGNNIVGTEKTIPSLLQWDYYTLKIIPTRHFLRSFILRPKAETDDIQKMS